MDLTNITICVVDCITPHLAARALERSTQKIQFAESLLLSNQFIEGTFKTVLIEPITSIDQYSNFIIKKLGNYIKTPYVLIIQWDGFIINPNAWSEDFLSYDYIGAKWPWHLDGFNIGNGGFSLRSKKLLDLLSQDKFQLPEGENEDEFICRHSRKKLEKMGIKFAPESIADHFSYEMSIPKTTTFGFHGFRNMWKHITEVEMLDLFKELHPSTFKTQSSADLLLQYYISKNETALLQLYNYMKKNISIKEIYRLVQNSINLNTLESEKCILTCEELLSRLKDQKTYLKINLSLEIENIPSYTNINYAPKKNEPWPYLDNSVEEIVALNFFTNSSYSIEDFPFVLVEFKRISIIGAKINFHIPYEKNWNRLFEELIQTNPNFIIEKKESISTQILPSQLKSNISNFGDLNFAVNKYIDTKKYWDIILSVK